MGNPQPNSLRGEGSTTVRHIPRKWNIQSSPTGNCVKVSSCIIYPHIYKGVFYVMRVLETATSLT